LATLDKRYEEKIRKEGILVARKPRKYGSPSNTFPPPDAPRWTVDQEWAKGLFSVILLLHYSL
jgi:hypothetical protein